VCFAHVVAARQISAEMPNPRHTERPRWDASTVHVSMGRQLVLLAAGF
jgi:hypothetical protein